MISIEEKGIEVPVLNIGEKTVKISTLGGHTITCKHAVEATCVPLQKLSVIAEMEYDRTYCIAIRIPKGSIEDCLLYDTAEEYKYLRLTECDEKDDYIVLGGCDHKVGQEDPTHRFEELEKWTRDRFTKAGTVDYKWSGQVFEPVGVWSKFYSWTMTYKTGRLHGVHWQKSRPEAHLHSNRRFRQWPNSRGPSRETNSRRD
jgi:hypothetical protein